MTNASFLELASASVGPGSRGGEHPRDETTGKREQWEHMTCPEAASGSGLEGKG